MVFDDLWRIADAPIDRETDTDMNDVVVVLNTLVDTVSGTGKVVDLDIENKWETGKSTVEMEDCICEVAQGEVFKNCLVGTRILLNELLLQVSDIGL